VQTSQGNRPEAIDPAVLLAAREAIEQQLPPRPCGSPSATSWPPSTPPDPPPLTSPRRPLAV